TAVAIFTLLSCDRTRVRGSSRCADRPDCINTVGDGCRVRRAAIPRAARRHPPRDAPPSSARRAATLRRAEVLTPAEVGSGRDRPPLAAEPPPGGGSRQIEDARSRPQTPAPASRPEHGLWTGGKRGSAPGHRLD